MDVSDTTDRLAWGWLAVLHNLVPTRWILPTEAALRFRIPTWKLRYWSDQGIITCIHRGPGNHRRYLASELELVRRITGNYPTLLALKWHIDVALKVGFSTELRRK